MAFGSVTLVPGVSTDRTPTLNQAGVSQSQLIRYKDALLQKYGGWARYFPFALAGTVRDLHGWADLNSNTHLLVGSTTALQFLTTQGGVQSALTITPQTKISDFSPNFSTTSGSPTVAIVDSNISNVTTFDAVFFNTPVAVGGLVLSGLYPIASITGASSYTITAAKNATTIVNNGGVVPVFTTAINSAKVNIALTLHGQSIGDTINLPIATTGNGVTILGNYTVIDVTDVNNFSITVTNQATASGSFSMNGGSAELIYYISLGPAPSAQGYGLGLYGAGLYGFGTSGGSSQTGTPITATDWTSDNWGSFGLACPSGGGVYYYDPTGGFSTAVLIATAPIFNGGIFVSTTLQILFCWGSTEPQGIGVSRDPMLISWSDQGDFTNFAVTSTDQAGSFRIPIGSVIRGGMAVGQANLFWTDLDLWAANYAGFPLEFGFAMIGSGAGAISAHSMQRLRGSVYWMGPNNFFSYGGGGVQVIPCPVWDAVFQNINTAFSANVRAMPNTPFNEAGWLYPSSASVSGECDSYVKFNITEPNQPWDYGLLARAAWIDASALGMPISATSNGIIYLQETTNNADGAAITSSFTTGYFYIAEGQEYAFVDQIIPDMIWQTFDGSSTSASIFLTFHVTNYPGDTPTDYGPYQITSATEFITVRFRGRQMSITLQSADSGSFWRLGKIRYRYGPAGRR